MKQTITLGTYIRISEKIIQPVVIHDDGEWRYTMKSVPHERCFTVKGIRREHGEIFLELCDGEAIRDYNLSDLNIVEVRTDTKFSR